MDSKDLQVENGNFTRLINVSWEELVKAPLLGKEMALVFFLIRKTYGFQKTADIISISQFQKGINASRPTVVKALKNLIARNIIVKTLLPGNKISYKFNKNPASWIVKTPKLVKSRGVYSKDALTKTSKDALTHKRKKETNTKDNITASKARNEVNQIFDLFYESINPTINYGNTTNRKATQFLISKYGLDKIIELTKYAISIQGQSYSPTITTPYQLKEKLGQLKIYVERLKSKSGVTIV